MAATLITKALCECESELAADALNIESEVDGAESCALKNFHERYI